jgi:serine/threonine-protein kinase
MGGPPAGTGRESTLPAGDAADARVCPLCGTSYPLDFVVCPRDASPLGLAEPDVDPLLGQVLAGTYRVLRLMAEGGMGRLYEAEHLRLERRVAVKVMHERWAKRTDLLARFEREARVLGRIRSPHVVQVLDVLQTADARPCIVCEKLEGEDLEARLARDGTLPLAVALDIARQACAGLADAHAAGVVHRDLKPSNLFLVAGGGVKVLDFGVARLAEGDDEARLTRTGAVVGTPAYMAPEQARGAAGVDARSDVYAVGAVLYRMLTGKAPYAGPDASSTLAAVIERAPTRPRAIDDTISEGVEAIVQTAMARDPTERPATAEAFAVKLAAFAPATARVAGDGAQAIEAQRGEAALRTREAQRARPRAAVMVALAACAAASVTAGALGLFVAAMRETAQIGTTDLVLVVLAGTVALVGTGIPLGRALAVAWDSTPRTVRFGRVGAQALAWGVATLGVLELLARLDALRDKMPMDGDPLWVAARLVMAALVALAAWRLALREKG